MYAHRIETTINEIGIVKLDTLPFVPGDKVEIIILKRETANNVQQPLAKIIGVRVKLK